MLHLNYGVMVISSKMLKAWSTFVFMKMIIY